MRQDRIFVILWITVLAVALVLVAFGNGEGDIALFSSFLATSFLVAINLRRRAVSRRVARLTTMLFVAAFVGGFVAVHSTATRAESFVDLAANLALEILLLTALMYFELRYWRGFERVASLLSAEADGYATVLDGRQAAPQMEAEFARSARHGDPLTVVVFERDPESEHRGIDSFAHALDTTGPGVVEHLSRVFARTQLSALMSERARRSDLVVTHSDSRIIVVSSATPSPGAEIFAERMRVASRAKLGISLVAGVAAWPTDGTNVDELVALATRRARADEPAALPPDQRADVQTIDVTKTLPVPAPLSVVEP